MAAFDPYAISPDFASQGGDVVTAWQRALAKLNFDKNNVLQKYGFGQQGDLSGSGNLNPDGTYKSTNLSGGLNAVGNISGFVGMDNKSGQGAYRDELTAEANALNVADNGPNRGFSGGLANQAKAAAQLAVNRSQSQFTQGYNQFTGGFNIAGQQSQGEANQSLGGILRNQAEYKANEALWQSTLPAPVDPNTTYTPGISGGGATPKWTPAQTAMSYGGYRVNQAQLNKNAKQGGTTFNSSPAYGVTGYHGRA